MLLEDDEHGERKKGERKACVCGGLDDAVTPFLVTRECAHARYIWQRARGSILNGDNLGFSDLAL